ncbi:MAG: nuclear transport factor 2 family protein [Actinomycetota bacterium]
MSAKLENAKSLYLEGIRDGNARQAIEAYTGDRYTQHSTGVADGKEGFVAFFEPFLERNPVRDIQIIRAIEDGQYVFLHVFQNINDGEARWVTTDFFDTDENDKIIEHWDVIAAYVDATPSGRTSIDGPTEVTDLDKTEANKTVVRELITNALMPGGDPSRIGEWIADEYIQHNPDVPDGLASFAALAQDPNRPLNYHEIVLLVGQGNFVATLCRATWEQTEMAQVDVFRLEDGKVVEHWDNAEPVPENDVNSGKF